MRPLVARASREQARREKPCSPLWVVGSRTVQALRVVGKGGSILQALAILVIPSSCDIYPSCSFLLPPGLTKNVLSTVSPFPKTLWDRDHGVNVKMPPHSQASFVGKEEGSGFNLTVSFARKESPLPTITMPRVPVLQYCTCSRR